VAGVAQPDMRTTKPNTANSDVRPGNFCFMIVSFIVGFALTC